jgi:tetratricopeptide (TPR) repeat protein
MRPLRCWPGLGALGIVLLALGPAFAQELSWSSDYAAARRAAWEKGKPLLLAFGSGHCFWCKKLDQVTFHDPGVARMLREHFVLLRLDGEREMKLAQMLGVRSYPTVVFAAPDGRILDTHEGFVNPAGMKELLGKALALSASPGPAAQVIATRPASGGIVPASATVPDPERVQTARSLLALAQDEFQKQQYALCLERCRALANSYADLPEGAEAQRLAQRIQSEPTLALRVCAELSDRLGELYLGLAEGLLRQGQTAQAVPYLERVLAVAPGSALAETAHSHLARLSSQSPAATLQAPEP